MEEGEEIKSGDWEGKCVPRVVLVPSSDWVGRLTEMEGTGVGGAVWYGLRDEIRVEVNPGERVGEWQERGGVHVKIGEVECVTLEGKERLGGAEWVAVAKELGL